MRTRQVDPSWHPPADGTSRSTTMPTRRVSDPSWHPPAVCSVDRQRTPRPRHGTARMSSDDGTQPTRWMDCHEEQTMEETDGKQESEVVSVIKVAREPAIIINGVPDLPLDNTSDPQPEVKNDTGAQVDPRFGEWLEGRKVKKLFGGTYYVGKVAKYDSESNWYSVIYDDGDQEDLDWSELEEVLLPLDITVPLRTLVIDKCRLQGAVPDYKPKVGRPRKIYGSTKKTSNMVPVSEGNDSKPGVPPSTSNEPTSAQLVTEENVQLEGSNQPRKRGRPRKDRTSPADNQSIAADNQAKRRGRPPKNRSVSGQSAENTPGSLALVPVQDGTQESSRRQNSTLKSATMTVRAEKLKRDNLRAQGSSYGTQLL